MELRLRSAAAAAIWLAQCRRAAVGTAPPAGQAGSSGSSGFEPRAGRWAGLPRRMLERRQLPMVLMVVRVAARPRSVVLILGEPLIRSLRMVYRRNAACDFSTRLNQCLGEPRPEQQCSRSSLHTDRWCCVALSDGCHLSGWPSQLSVGLEPTPCAARPACEHALTRPRTRCLLYTSPSPRDS